MNNDEILEFSKRALIGDFRNMSTDCVENLRPRAQYMHFYRASLGKISEVLNRNHGINDIYSRCLSEIKKYLESNPKATHNTQEIISKDIINILSKYGFYNYDEQGTTSREIGY